jgi:diguanylate cyclase (GGDEF)-like protein
MEVSERVEVEGRAAEPTGEWFRVAFARSPAAMAIVGLGDDGPVVVEANNAFGRIVPSESLAGILAGPPAQVLAGGAQHVEGEHVVAARGGVARRLVVVATPLPAAGDRLVLVQLTDSRLPAPGGESGPVRNDPLTGLPTREVVIERLRQVGLDDGQLLGVLSIDLDNFSAVNEVFGTSAGDRLLVEIAERLQDALRPGDVAARAGSDEFLICCHHLGRSAEAARDNLTRIAQRIRGLLGQPIGDGRTVLQITASVGGALGQSGVDLPEVLLSAAAAAMAQARDLGGNAIDIAAPPSASSQPVDQ